MRAWAIVFIAGGVLWFAADLVSALAPAHIAVIWTAAFGVAIAAGALGGMRRKTPAKARAWLWRYLATFAINAALAASVWSLGNLQTAIAIDVASALFIASLYLTSALWSSFLRPTLATAGAIGWIVPMAGYFLLPDQAGFVMAGAGGYLLAAPGVAILRLLPARKRKIAAP